MEATSYYAAGTNTWACSTAYPSQFPPFEQQQQSVYDAEWETFRAWLRAKIDSLPTYSVARTLLEDDERFYLTFPGARRAAIDEWKMQHAAQTGTSGSEHYCSQSSAAPLPTNLQLHYDYDYCFPTEQAAQQLHQTPVHPSYNGPQWVDNVRDHTIDTIVPSFLEAQDQLESPIASSSRAVTPPRSPSPVASPIDAPLRRARSFTLSPPRMQFTGDWEADALAASRAREAPAPQPAPLPAPLSAPPAPLPLKPEMEIEIPPITLSETPVVIPRTNRRHHLTYRRQRLTRSHTHPYDKSRSTSPRLVSAKQAPVEEPTPLIVEPSPPSPPPPMKRKAIGEGKMACLFCRGRKIACQPPPVDDPDRTCNQCKRRNQDCTYPTENRRGMRRPRQDSEHQVEA